MLKSHVLRFPVRGEIKMLGYSGKMIDFVLENQLMDTELWALFVEQFRRREDSHNGGWRGEYWGKMMRGASLTYTATKNEALYSVLATTVRDLLTTQDKYGRISSYSVEKEFHAWDMWGRKYIMLGLIYFLDICKSKALASRIIRALKRHGDYIISKIGKEDGKISIFKTSDLIGALNSCSILEAFVRLYTVTGEKSYLDFASYIVETGFSESEDLIELSLSKTKYPYQFPVTKAYELMSCFEGLLEYYRVTKEQKYLEAVENLVDMIISTDYTIVGGAGCRHEFFDNSTRTQTEPPVQDVMQETCVTVTLIKLCAKLLATTGDAKYASYIERSGFNALYGAVNNEGQTMCNTQARTWLEGGRMVWIDDHGPFPFDSYSPLLSDKRGFRIGGMQLLGNGKSYGCCVCIGSAGTAIMALSAIMKGDDGIYINTYADAKFKTEISGSKTRVDVYANPYDYHGVKINVYGNSDKFNLCLRIPDWAENLSVFVNGDPVSADIRNGYMVIRRTWGCDKVLLKFKTPVRMSVLNGKIAFTRGPIVLSRDKRFDDLSAPLNIRVKNGKTVRAKKIENSLFPSNSTYELQTPDGSVRLCDYSQAGKNFDDDVTGLSVWQEYKK